MKRVSKKVKTIPEIYEEFQQHNKVKNLSEHTITYYYWNLKHLFDYLTEKKIAVIAEINSEVFDDYILWLKERYSNAITINTYLRSARVFLYYSMSKDYLPSFKIHMIKAEDKVIQTYSDAEIAKLIKKPDLKKCSFVEYRNWILCIYFLETGNRLQSVINIKVSDVDFEQRYVILRQTKNRHQQFVPLTQALLDVLPDYIGVWGLEQDSYLFPNVEGNQLSEDAIKASMSHYNRIRGVTISGIHRFRHTFAASFIRNGGGAFQLQQLLAHSDISTTQRYVHFFGNYLQDEVEKYSIVGRLKPSRKHITRQK